MVTDNSDIVCSIVRSIVAIRTFKDICSPFLSKIYLIFDASKGTLWSIKHIFQSFSP